MSPAESLGRAAIGAMRRGDTERAAELLERAKAWSPESAQVHEAEGVIALFECDWRKAESAFRCAMAAGVYSSRTYTGLGLSLLGQGKVDYAMQSFEYSLTLASHAKCAWSRRALQELEAASHSRGTFGRRGSPRRCESAARCAS